MWRWITPIIHPNLSIHSACQMPRPQPFKAEECGHQRDFCSNDVLQVLRTRKHLNWACRAEGRMDQAPVKVNYTDPSSCTVAATTWMQRMHFVAIWMILAATFVLGINHWQPWTLEFNELHGGHEWMQFQMLTIVYEGFWWIRWGCRFYIVEDQIENNWDYKRRQEVTVGVRKWGRSTLCQAEMRTRQHCTVCWYEDQTCAIYIRF